MRKQIGSAYGGDKSINNLKLKINNLEIRFSHIIYFVQAGATRLKWDISMLRLKAMQDT